MSIAPRDLSTPSPVRGDINMPPLTGLEIINNQLELYTSRSSGAAALHTGSQCSLNCKPL